MGSPVVYIDNCVFICAHGGNRESDGDSRDSCRSFLTDVSDGRIQAITSEWTIEGLRRRDEATGGPEKTDHLIRQLRKTLVRVLPITDEVISRAGELEKQFEGLPHEDAVHASAMLQNEVNTIVTLDKHYRLVDELRVVHPRDRSELLSG